MSNNQLKVKPGFWVVAGIIAFFAYALMADWWKDNSAVGWTIMSIILLGFAFSLYRFPSVRKMLLNTAKQTSKNAIFEKETSRRETVPADIKREILARSHSKCENPDCYAKNNPELHHIDNNRNNNNPNNIIALCPNCHAKTDSNEITNSQLRNWVHRSWQSYKRSQLKSH